MQIDPFEKKKKVKESNPKSILDYTEDVVENNEKEEIEIFKVNSKDYKMKEFNNKKDN
ncbi:hypothetical protein [Sporosalibacterium faouarense]|uniref:hypothetical protein n=1 Tax=Sporosalibacterium faouarense TaxID=516123 RepID=UPI00192C222D|nr:hypothetical protein [Sporosalibacterium faouarense]